MITLIDRTEFDHNFRALPDINAWTTTSGREVLIYPPLEKQSDWWVDVPSQNRKVSLRGRHVVARAFCIAEGFSRQPD